MMALIRGATLGVLAAMLLACSPDATETVELPSSALLRIAMPVRDIEASKHFYGYALGYETGYEGDITSPWVSGLLHLEPGQTVQFVIMYGADSLAGEVTNSAMIGLLQVANPSLASLQRPEDGSLRTGEVMMAMVTADIDRVYARLQELGATILFGPTESVDGSESELVFRDPDGVRIHIVQRHQ